MSTKRRKHVFLVVGARPNFMKAAALCRAFRRRRIRIELCHTGQHYDRLMSDGFFSQLGLPRPKYFLGVGSGSHAEQTGRAMAGIERALLKSRPALVIVVGDVNSTAAGALAAVKLGIPVAHVEAGLRSGDRDMPEEINRIVTDSVSDYHFVTEPDAVRNLRREGADMKRVFEVGNVMIDTLLRFKPRAAKLRRSQVFGLPKEGFALSTLHRPSNVDDRKTLTGIVDAFGRIGRELPLVLSAHPRTQKQLRKFGLLGRFGKLKELRANRGAGVESGLWLLPPQDYLSFLSLMLDCRLVLTDSGGLQDESSALGKPCLTLRWNTERVVTVKVGTSRLVGNALDEIVRASGAALSRPENARHIPMWDGKSADRIARKVAGILQKTGL